ncbi:hypothetical protein COU60_05480 [Candidatus Pacearchaeota archaeon CG10_big_fil_rev_8_21_14_0_10_34_76]|nr:MAG: hypothetical protein COU60_05480 [Candidatus Pacearchaeota archaeon CG10_big_fil_rev_8_21_14_0_10_34_76]
MSRSKKVELFGERILLRGLRETDADTLVKIANDAEISKYTPLPFPFSLTDAEKIIGGTRNAMNRDKSYFLGIEFDETIIGMAGLLNLSRPDKSSEVGYWVGKDYRGKGFATEALKLVIDFGFREEQLQKLWGRVTENNSVSIAILEGQGFYLVERIPKARMIDGVLTTDLVYELTNHSPP